MTRKRPYLLAFVIFAALQLAVLWGMRSDYQEVVAEGVAYRIPIAISRHYYGGADYDAPDYVTVEWRPNEKEPYITFAQARWLGGPDVPKSGETVYVAVARTADGKMEVKGADFRPPAQGDYIRTVSRSMPDSIQKDGVIDFALPFRRYYADKRELEQIPWEEYTATDTEELPPVDASGDVVPGARPEKIEVPRHRLEAEIRLLNGAGAVTGIFVDGQPIHSMYRTAADDTAVRVTPVAEESGK